jgi:thiol-disulfide isomerase/thioredoxin
MTTIKTIFNLLILIILVLSACQSSPQEQKTIEDEQIDTTSSNQQEIEQSIELVEETTETDTTIENIQEIIKETITFTGKELANNYYEFNQEDYENALQNKQIILLYFYASWCPICKTEQKETFGAFNELDKPNLVGFRVNYRDPDTDDNEVALAKEFGVSYQHTKVILKNKERILKAPDSWYKDRYIEELNKVT